MKILEPGHIYALNVLDGLLGETDNLTFVNREPGKEHPGYQTQEVLRALIDRTRHCDKQHLRMALVLHEARALERKVEEGKLKPEIISTGTDGHFVLTPTRPDPKSSVELKLKDKLQLRTPNPNHYCPT